MRLLLRGGVVHALSGPATAVALEGGRVVFVGSDDRAAAYAAADEVIELAGALVTPGFVDAHVHTVQTGFQLTQLDLRGALSRGGVMDLVSAHARDSDPQAVLVGTGWDETRWPESTPPTTAELERAAPGQRVILDRVDGHSSILSAALVASVPGLEGIEGYTGDGRVERDARHAVNATLAGLIGPEQRLRAARAGVAHLAAQGVVAFHENAAPHIGPEYEIDLVRRAAGEVGLLPTLYWGELRAVETARRLGVAGLAGDLNADGAIGSRTSALREAYADCPGHAGHAYLDAETIAEHVVLCTQEGLQAGFHCIGDAAVDAVAEGLVRAEEKLGTETLRAAGHRLEHVEMPSARAIEVLARLQVTASVQPQFDALWGGPDQMYAERLGGRWRGMNPFRALAAAGVPIALGSDTPVTDANPWAAIRAVSLHREHEQRLDVQQAFRSHTAGGWAAARVDRVGALAPGQPAHLAVWDCPSGLTHADLGPALPDLRPGADLPRLRRLLVAGRSIHPEGGR